MLLHECRKGIPKWCSAFEGCHVRNIAVVGNGPLSAQQRSELNSGRFQVIVRFNYLNNRLPGEQLDIWVMRWGDTAKLHFWGLSQMTTEEGAEALGAADALWLMAEPRTGHAHWKALQPLYRRFPAVESMEHLMLSPQDTRRFPGVDRWPGTDAKAPSTGWLGTVYALQCAQSAGAVVHMYGFNWHDKHGDTHPHISDESKFFQQAEERGLLIIHPTACAGLRSCGKRTQKDARRDCRIVGTDVLGRDVYRCKGSLSEKDPAAVATTATNKAKVQALMKQLFGPAGRTALNLTA
ncbi:hypothetical protein CVIRNUC_010804 [Coccomyxa viridis]|uniref:Uncharacterized protein n=1 Tax=Coccomyxa viridis TaxID=1274662 RepID=A0AAV1ILL4_9CHLO|nr:hypothetical protein CVIRNUC_010804 [Coccomyxa viridis]